MMKSILNDGPAATPVLFLDIDGVMNTSAFALANHSGLIFRTESVISLNRILTESGCRVVISSSWRREPRINLGAIFETQGVAKFRACLAGITPDLSNEECCNRGDEIEAWLSKERFTGRLAILDDDPIMGPFDLWHCRTDESKGLTTEVANRVIAMLVYGPVYREGALI